MLGIAIFLIGLTLIGGQIIIPYVAYLTPISEQGQVLGAMISGMLTGILFARTFSGVIASLFGWRAVYGLAAILNLFLFMGIHFVVPDDPRSHLTILGHRPNNRVMVEFYERCRCSLSSTVTFGAQQLTPFACLVWPTSFGQQ